MSFLCLLCPVRKWDVVSDYQMFISCQGYCMFCVGLWHTGYCCYQDLDSPEDRNSVWAAVGDAIFDLRQLFLDQIVTYTEQTACTLMSIWVTFLSLPFVHFICSTQCVLQLGLVLRVFSGVFCHRAKSEKKKKNPPFSCFALRAANWLLFSLTPVLPRWRMQEGGLLEGTSVNGIYISVGTCGAQRICSQVSRIMSTSIVLHMDIQQIFSPVQHWWTNILFYEMCSVSWHFYARAGLWLPSFS